MNICTAIIEMQLLWNEVLSGTSDEAATHKVLIWVSLAGEILVAIGILLEIERPLNCKKILSFVAVITGVILSAAGTLLLLNFDESISSLQQSKIIALETPRILSRDAEKRLVDKISAFPGTPYVWVQVAEIEVIFERAFLRALKSAGWKGDNAGVEKGDDAAKEELAAADAKGIRIWYGSSRAGELKQPSEALRDALNDEKLTASAGETPANAELPPEMIHIQIGTRQ